MNNITIDDVVKRSLIHGRVICGSVLKYYEEKLPLVNISEDIKIITVIGKGQKDSCVLKKSNITDNQIEIFEVENYKAWYSKIDGLRNYINDNYDELPEYILYMDGFDTLVINDFNSPKEILDFYKCKVLFNSTVGFWHTGAKSPNSDEKYFEILYTKIKHELLEKTQNKFNLDKNNETSLNSGVFVGEKDFVLKIINEAYDYMSGDPNKGFPYGTNCDQSVFKFLHNKYFDDISIDFYNKISIWGSNLNFNKDVN